MDDLHVMNVRTLEEAQAVVEMLVQIGKIPNCEHCMMHAMRQLGPQISDEQGTIKMAETYTYRYHSGGTITFSVEHVKVVLGMYARFGINPPLVRLHPEEIAPWIEARTKSDDLIVAHVNHLPLQVVLQTPLLFVQLPNFDNEPGVPEGEPVALPIDGTHRAARCLQDRLPIYAYILSPEETKLCIVHMHLPPEKTGVFK